MQLVEDIIDVLSDENAALGAALLKAQVLAHRLGEKEVGAWVGMELRGYPKGAEVPDYRKITLIPRAQLTDGYRFYNDFGLPLLGLPPDVVQRFREHEVRDSIAVVEGFKKPMSVPYNAAHFKILASGLSKDWNIVSSWGEVPPGAFKEITVEVRSRLLTMMLELSDRLPDDPAPEAIRRISQEVGVADVFKGAVLNGSHTINIAVGNHNTVSSTVTKNDFSSVAAELRRHAVPEQDIQQLQTAIESDGVSPDHSRGRYGSGVRQWLAGMMTKAGTTAWDISSNTAAGVLATAVGKYYGLS